MLPFALYLLKVTICSGILFGYYWFMLRNKIFHQYNRFYLLAIVLLSLALPVIQVNIWHAGNAPAPQAIQLLQVVNNSNEYLDEIIIKSKSKNISTEQSLALLYSFTTLAFLAIFIQTIFRIRTLFKKHRHSLVENVYFVNTTAKGTPFSFLRYIFWNDHIDPESATGHQIFKHELAHVKQKHSYDKLFINATLVICWCNPFFWLIRKELNMIHEFMADKIAVEDSDTETFATMILQATYPQHRFHLTNPFFYSPIKRRLMMLTKNRNPKVGYIGRLMVLPLTILMFAAFTLKAKTFNLTNPVYNGKTINVVVDAGHGGSDLGARSTNGNIVEKDLTLAIIKKIKAINKNASINIILTRESDVFQTVQEKAAFTISKKADLFVSIHTDATSVDSADVKTGMSVYVAKDNYRNSTNSKLFASAIIDQFSNNYKLPVNNLPQQRAIGIKVLQESLCPSVIIEAGYITNQKDLAYLQTEEAKESIAKNILSAIERYAFATEKPVGISSATTKNTIVSGSQKQDTIPQVTLKNQAKALIILDGKTISNEEMKKIDPENIESVSVFKDETALAKYGEKGKNGVVIIKTKVKELLLKDLPVTISGDTSTEHLTLKGNIKIRGNSIQDPAKKPLYVIDGKIKNESIDLNSIDPNEIKSINVIKGKTALEKYGDKGENGVIEIITKPKDGAKQITTTGFLSDDITANQQDDKIFTQVENEPKFPGGDTAWRNYLQKNINLATPVDEGWIGGTYKIIVSFIVKKDGSITDVTTDNYKGSKTADECIKLISKGPKWNAAIQNGHIVTAYKKQPITFVIEQQ